MSSEKSTYHLISLGRMDGKSEQDTITNLAKLYRTSTDKVQHFLVPETHLQTVTSQELAEKYQRAYRISGVQCRIELPEKTVAPTTLKTKETTENTINNKDKVEYNDPYDAPKAAVYEPTTNNEVEYAGFKDRFLAHLMDRLLLSLTVIALFFIYDTFLGTEFAIAAYNDTFNKGGWDASGEDYPFYFEYIFAIIVTLGFWQYYGATPGKMFRSAKIVDAKTGEKPAMWRLIVRYLSYILSTIPLLLGFIWIAFDKRKQGWHDKLAGTVVIKH